MNKKELFNEEREIPDRQKVVCRSNVPVLTPHASLNPRLCTALNPCVCSADELPKKTKTSFEVFY